MKGVPGYIENNLLVLFDVEFAVVVDEIEWEFRSFERPEYLFFGAIFNIHIL